MLNLSFPLLGQPLSLEKATFLIVESVTMFTKIMKWFYQYSEPHKLKLFSDKYKELKESDLLIIADVLGFDINSAPTLKLIYADLKRQLNEKVEVRSMIDKLITTISELIGYELLDHELDLEGDETTILKLFEALGIRIETRSDTIFEKLLELLQVYRYLSKKKLLVSVNVCSYLAEKGISEAQDYISLYHMEMLFVEPRSTKEIKQFVLDKDYFLNLENMV